MNKEDNDTGCIDYLLKFKEHFDIDSQDSFGNTALHYVVQDNGSLFHTLTKTLIKNGACMDVKNDDGICVIDIIPPSTIEDILDECIIESNDRKYENYELKMDLGVFSHKERSLYTRNESQFIRALQNSESLKHLLYHPLITTFLHIKWQKVKYIWYLNMLCNMGFFLLIFVYIYLYRDDLLANKVVENNMCLLILRTLITIIASVLLLREISQLYFFRKEYIQSFENYLEIAIIGLTCSMLHTTAIHSQPKIVAWLVVFISVEFLLLLEKLHQIKLSLYISMFRKVAYNFVKLSIILICIVIAFAVSFYLLIPMKFIGSLSDGMNEQNETLNGNKNENKFPATFKEAFLKTLIMSTGEFDHSSLDFEYFPASRLLFCVFIFSILLVALNLLNGIAISDIQAIQKDASKYHIQDQIECLLHFDNLQPIYNWLDITTMREKGLIYKCFPDKIIRIYPNGFEGLIVMCEGHTDVYYLGKWIYVKCFKSGKKNIKRCEDCELLKDLHRCKKCGEGKKYCEACMDKINVNDQNDQVKHNCVYKHTYTIPLEYILSAKQNKEELQRKRKENEIIERIASLEKSIEDVLKQK